MKIEISHPPFRRNQETYLSSNIIAGVSSIPVKNSSGFKQNSFALLGLAGMKEQSELVSISNVPNVTEIQIVSPTKYQHSVDTKVTFMDFNKINVYRSISGVAGDYSLVATLDIQYDHFLTTFDDPDAQPTYYYKFAYLNSLSSTEDDLSDPYNAAGISFYSLNTIVMRVRSVYGDPYGEFVDFFELRDAINDFYLRAQRNLTLSSKRFNLQKKEFALERGKSEYPIDPSFLFEAGVEVKRSTGERWEPIVMRQVDSLGNVRIHNFPFTYMVRDQTIDFDPVPQEGTWMARVWYMPYPTLLQYPTDTLRAPFLQESEHFIRAGHAYCFLKEKKMEEYKLLRSISENGMNDFVSFLGKISKKHPQYVENRSF